MVRESRLLGARGDQFPSTDEKDRTGRSNDTRGPLEFSHHEANRIGKESNMKTGAGHHVARSRGGWRPIALVAATGLALGLNPPSADAVTRARIRLRASAIDTILGGVNQAGSTVIVGNIDGAQVWPTHVAFGDRVLNVWWTANVPASFPNAGDARGEFFTAHATAAASAMAGNWPVIANAPAGLANPSVIGFAPAAEMILSTGFAAAVGTEGTYLGVTDNAMAFSIFAITDPVVAGFASNLLGIPPYEVASVVNASFGSVVNELDRMGESTIAHAFDAAVWRNDTVIVVAAGDQNQNQDLLDQIEMDPSDPGGTIAGPATAWNVVGVGQLAQNGTTAADTSGEGPIGVVDWRKAAGIIMPPNLAGLDFNQGCPDPATLTESIVRTRRPIRVAAPGASLLLAGSPQADPPGDFPQAAADTAFLPLWTGTSFSSAIVAGAAALIQDAGNKLNLWPKDDEGNNVFAGLATRAILMNSTNQSGSLSPELQQDSTGSDQDACIFSNPFDTQLGVGTIDLDRARKQLFASGSGVQAADVRASQPMRVDGIDRPLNGLTRRDTPPDETPRPDDFQPTVSDPFDIFRNPPPLFDPQDVVTADGPAPEQEEGWFTGWESFSMDTLGTEVDRPFVTTFRAPVDPAFMPVMAPPADRGGVRDVELHTEITSPGAAPEASRKKSSKYKPYGQPGLTFPDEPNLEQDPIDFFGPSLTPLPQGGTGGGSSDGGGSGGDSFRRTKTGWDVGRLGVGFIDYPLGFITPMSSFRATLVWNRTEIWNPTEINSWASDVPGGFRVLDKQKIRPVVTLPDNDPTSAFAMIGTVFSSDDFLFPTIQTAYAMENLDIEIFRLEAGTGNVLVARSNQVWDTAEHVSVGPQNTLCSQADILAGNYILRVSYVDTMFDLGGFRWCGDLQSLQMISNLSTSSNALSGGYQNLYPAEVPFAVAWFVDLANAPGIAFLQENSDGPVDMDGNGVIDEHDVEAMMMAALGDFNGDGVIGATDLSMLLSKFGQHAPEYDLTQDGDVNAADLAAMLAHFGPTPLP